MTLCSFRYRDVTFRSHLIVFLLLPFLGSESCKPSETTFIVAVVDARLSHIERLNELHKGNKSDNAFQEKFQRAALPFYCELSLLLTSSSISSLLTHFVVTHFCESRLILILR